MTHTTNSSLGSSSSASARHFTTTRDPDFGIFSDASAAYRGGKASAGAGGARRTDETQILTAAVERARLAADSTIGGRARAYLRDVQA